MRAALSLVLKGWRRYDQSVVVRLGVFAIILVVAGTIGRIMVLQGFDDLIRSPAWGESPFP